MPRKSVMDLLVSDFPRFCANNCGSVLYKREEAVRVKFTRNLDGTTWYDWVCKGECQPERTYADANGFCPFDAGGNNA